ncbi:winged helix-turn-helix transcriptional regulator [Oceanicola sp. S124]|uniref:winged helix-turn-helix transcriptional regulator n=1 Tax=Oceanicola sp. S124 TaxID=1042378 RepID=UPI00025578B4|nr:helix-turn-helix domain-containing protein [Oceanicola sp. S124]
MPEPKAPSAAVCRPDECVAEDWLGFLGHRWNALLLWHLSGGPKRYSELQALLPRISPKVLTDRITGLTRRDLVQRTETNTYPREVTYGLTARGEALRTILSELYDWAADVAHEDAFGLKPAE